MARSEKANYAMSKGSRFQILLLNFLVFSFSLGLSFSFYWAPTYFLAEDPSQFHFSLGAMLLSMLGLFCSCQLLRMLCEQNMGHFSLRAQTQLLNHLCDRHHSIGRDNLTHIWRDLLSNESYYFAKARWYILASYLILTASFVPAYIFEQKFSLVLALFFVFSVFRVKRRAALLRNQHKAMENFQLKEEQELLSFVQNLDRFIDERRSYEKSSRLRSLIARKLEQNDRTHTLEKGTLLPSWLFLIVSSFSLILFFSTQTLRDPGLFLSLLFFSFSAFFVLHFSARSSAKTALLERGKESWTTRAVQYEENELSKALKQWILRCFESSKKDHVGFFNLSIDWSDRQDFLNAFRNISLGMGSYGNWLLVEGAPDYELRLKKNCNLVYFVSENDLKDLTNLYHRLEEYQNLSSRLIVVSPFEMVKTQSQFSYHDRERNVFRKRDSEGAFQKISDLYRANFSHFYPKLRPLLELPEQKRAELEVVFFSTQKDNLAPNIYQFLRGSMSHLNGEENSREIFWDSYSRFDTVLRNRYESFENHVVKNYGSSFHLKNMSQTLWVISLWNWFVDNDYSELDSYTEKLVA